MSEMRENWERARRILALRLDNLGDVVMTGPALRAIKENLPEAHLTLMVSPAGDGAARLLPWVDDVLAWRSLWQDLGELPFAPEREMGLIRTLQAQAFDAAIIFTSFSQTPHVAAYACYLAGIPLRLGEPKDFGGAVLTDMPPSPTPLEAHQVERNLRLIESVGMVVQDRSLAIRIPAADQFSATEALARRGLPPGAPYVLLTPWTSCPARTYTRFGAAGRQLMRTTGLPIVVAGAAHDRDRSQALLEELGPGAVSVVGETSFGELAALVTAARLVLTNNTATMHLADAKRRPQVVLFAGTELEQQWAPRHGPARLLRRATLCQPCFGFACPHGLACLDIEPEKVVMAALDLLQGRSFAAPSIAMEAS